MELEYNYFCNTLNNNFIFQLVSNALQFLATVADRSQYRHLFENPTTLSSICEKVIIPNMEFKGTTNPIFRIITIFDT